MKTQSSGTSKTEGQTDEIPVRSGLKDLCLQPGLVLPGEPLLCPHLRPPCTKWPHEAAVPLPLGGPSWSPQVSVEEGSEYPPPFLALPRALRARH